MWISSRCAATSKSARLTVHGGVRPNVWVGRKSCPPSAPICLRQPLVEAATGPEALLLAASEAADEPDAASTTAGPATLWWEAAPEPGDDAASRLGISGGFYNGGDRPPRLGAGAAHRWQHHVAWHCRLVEVPGRP